MKKTNIILLLILGMGNFLFAQTWDILDKSMAAWNVDGGAGNNKAWSQFQGGSAAGVATQQSGYVNLTKTNASTSSGYWSWVRSAAFADLTSATAYSIEVKARVKPVGVADAGSYYESNQISLRSKGDGISAPIYLKYGDGVSGGWVSATSGGTSNVYALNTAEWQVYRLVFHADHTKYDVYVDGVDSPILENIATITKGDDNGVYFGAEGNHRCNIDVEYVKMGTGDFYSNPKISSIALSRESHVSGNETTVSVTAYTYLIGNGEKLLFSFVDGNDSEIITPVEATVENNTAAINIVIPANVAYGHYAVKVAAKGQINGVNVTPKTVAYEIKDPLAAQTWDILDRDFSVKAWNVSPAWTLEKGGNVPTNFVTQQDGYVNINKTQAYGNSYYAFLISPAVTLSANTAYTYEIKARAQAIDKNEFPDVMKPTPSGVGGYEANQIGFLLNNKHMSFYLIYGDENSGYAASPVVDGTGVSPSSVAKHTLNTSEWHVYR
ncbi:MAG: hypothetical protein LBS25_00405, partial [Candidatus Symbiothrix sp.]|nr:hypothetical protein [Candidatus Symbiothrix sp.]